MKILGQKIKIGERNQLRLFVASLYTRTKIEIPVIVERAEKPGPTLLITGGIHGDEMNGIEIVRRLVFKGYSKPERGTVISLPVVNIFSFVSMQRKFADGRDLNRSFPGNIGGSLASQTAYLITEKIIPHADFALDMHSGGAYRFNHPQIRCDFTKPGNLELAKAFAAPFTLLQNKTLDKTLRSALTESGVPVILFEGGKSNIIDEDVVNYGVDGILNVMDYLKIRAKKEEHFDISASVILKDSSWVRAAHSGMFEPIAKNGQFVKKGQLLGYINGPFAQFHRQVKSDVSGYIFCVNLAAVVHLGDALFHIGQE